MIVSCITQAGLKLTTEPKVALNSFHWLLSTIMPILSKIYLHEYAVDKATPVLCFCLTFSLYTDTGTIFFKL